jgi:hypothetical protein
MGEITLKYMTYTMVGVTGLVALLIGLWLACLGIGGCLTAICSLCTKFF